MRSDTTVSPAAVAGRRRYPSDFSDEQWRTLADLLGIHSECRGARRASLRDVADAVNYRWHTGCSWRMLPHDFPPWPTVYGHVRRWSRRGQLGAVRAIALSRMPRMITTSSSSPAAHDGRSLAHAEGYQ